ncbi:uncharacterized protein LOC113782309 [Coffea eugenioides]|uniref:uncharacterized protein LOC113755754 n=1 Tax=Coffea eugenioides TaxID=49369 RepID=UPI000F60FDF6|nr:uncharacterized protein LOC113755754 [Coffea eugenioides]XP_027183999.1 uncharacterized protein LOC113782309 [Coffea eugenioides]
MAQSRRRTGISLSWSLPPFPYVKLNVDGSSLGNPGLTGVGGILRNHTGRVLKAFSTFYGFCTNTEIEAMALLEGLRLVPWRIDTIIRQVRQEISKADVILEHCYRELNSAADALTKGAAARKCSTTYDATTLPPPVKGISTLDIRQFPYVHLLRALD